MYKRNKKKLIKVITNLILIVLISIIVSINPQEEKIKVTLSSCIDGDTARFVTDKGIETTRFLAIDTPETVHPNKKVEPYGKEASTMTCDELTKARTIILEFDPNSDRYDKYDRLLAWVFVDGDLLQSKLINRGFAKVAYLYGNYKYTDILLQEQATSKEKKMGMWYNEQ